MKVPELPPLDQNKERVWHPAEYPLDAALSESEKVNKNFEDEYHYWIKWHKQLKY